MASHRKPRTRILSASGPRAAAGITTAAFATVTLLGESASAAPAAKPSISEVQTQVDTLYHQAEAATERSNSAEEKADKQRAKVDALLEQAAEKTQKLNDARRLLGSFAAAQYRNGGLDETSTFLLSDDPEQYLEQSYMVDRVSDEQQKAVEEFRTQQAAVTEKRAEAQESLTELTATQKKLTAEKKTVQQKLAQAQKLLNTLTAQEKARLAALELKKQKAAEQAAAQEAAASTGSTSSSSSSSSDSSAGSGSTSSRASTAIAFAKAQLGKPYISGAEGPDAYDCSGLTQAAYAAAGVALPRVTWDQVNAGTRVSKANLQPGDLVFFYSDISHVAIYLGNGKIVHAPRPGKAVEIGELSWMPFYAGVRVA